MMRARGHQDRQARLVTKGRALLALAALSAGFVALALSLVAGEAPAGAAQVSTCPTTLAGTSYKKWVGPANGAYETAANWSPSGVPASTNIICSDAGSSINLNSSRTVAGANLQGSLNIGSTRVLTLTASASTTPATTGLTSVLTDVTLDGTIQGAMPVDIYGANNVLRGTFLNGVKTITAGASATIDGTITLGTASAPGTLVNAGTLEWTTAAGANNIWLGGSTTRLENQAGATFAIKATDGSQIVDFASTTAKPKFINGGTITKSTETGTVYVNAGFDNGGSVTSTNGELNFQQGNTSGGSDAGSYGSSPSGAVRLSGGTRTFTGSTAITGTNGAILGGATVTFPSGGTTATVLHHEGGSFTGSVSISGSLEYTGGQELGAGTTTILSGATANIPNQADIEGSRTFLNKGTVHWGVDGGHFYLCGTATLQNEGTFHIDVPDTFQFLTCGSGNGSVVNKAGGTMSKDSAGVLYVSLPLDNKGTFQIVDGTVEMGGNTTGGTDTGAWVVPSGHNLQVDGGTRTEQGATFTGAGTVTVAGGTWDFGTTNVDVPNLRLAGGLLSGTATATDTFEWTGGGMSGTGTTTTAAAIDFDLPGGAYLDAGHTLKVAGAARWVGNYFSVCNGSTFEVASGGLLDLQGGGGYAFQSCGSTAGGLLVRSGGTVKRTADGQAYLSLQIDNHGTIESAAGIMSVNADSRPGSTGDTGVWTSSGGGVLGLDSGTRLFDGGTLTGPNTYLTGMTIKGTPTVDELTWTGGTFDYPGQANVTGTLDIPSGAALYGKLNNTGTVSWSGYYFDVCNGGVVDNQSGATFEILHDGGYASRPCGTGDNRFLNRSGGLLVKRGGTGTMYWSLPIDNTGTVRSESGNLSVQAANPAGSTGDTGTWTGTTGSVSFDSGTHLMDGATLTGAAYLNGATLTGTPNVDHLTWLSGTFAYPGQANVTGTLEVPSGAALYGKIHNTGTVSWSGYYFDVCNGGLFDNASGGTFEILHDGGYAIRQCNTTAPKFLNGTGATIVKRSGTGTLYWALPMDNFGQVKVQDGYLEVQAGNSAGSSDSGSYLTSAGAALGLRGGTRDFTSAVTLGGAGGTYMNGATLTGNPTYNGADVYLQSGGPSGTGVSTIASGTTLHWQGTALSNGRILNQGTTNWEGGYISMSNGARFQNAGTFNVEGGGYAFQNGGGAAPLFENLSTGTIRSNTGSVSYWDAPLKNQGNILVLSGPIAHNGPVGSFQSASGSTLNEGTYTLSDGFGFNGASIQNNAATVVLKPGGYLADSATNADAFTPLKANTSSGSLTLERDLTLSSNFQNAGTVAVKGATFHPNTYTQTAGQTTLSTATSKLQPDASTVKIDGGTLEGVGTVSGTLIGDGTVKPGLDGVGKLSVDGGYGPSSAHHLAIDITGPGTAGTAYDQLAVSNAAVVAGTLSLTTAPGYTPTAGDSFTILTAANRTGTFSSVTGASLPGDLYYAVHYTATTVTLTVTQQPVLSVGDASITEPSSGTSNVLVPITISDPPSTTVTVPWSTSDDTAKQPGDYTTTSGTATFNPGDPLTQTVSVPVKADALDEADETFTVDLGTPTNAGTADPQGVVTIHDDPADVAPTVSVDDVTVTEGDSGSVAATFTATLSGPSGKPITVGYATAGGTAVQDVDYTGTSGSLSFAAGDTTKTFTVDVLGDLIDEPTETYSVTLDPTTNVSAGDLAGVGTITDDGDPQPSVSVGDATVTEGDSGTVAATFHIGLSGISGREILVPWSTVDDSATSPADFTADSGTATIPAGQLGTDVTVSVKGDTIHEGDESFRVDLGTPTNATPGDTQGIGTITDDDTAAGTGPDTRTANGFTVGDLRVVEGEDAVFTISRTGSIAEAASVKFATSDSTADAGIDYAAVPSTLTVFAANVRTKTVTVPTTADSAVEANETFKLSLSSPSNAVVLDGSATATIDDPGAEPAAFAIGDVNVAEGGTATFTVTRSGDTSQTSSVTVASADGTAHAGTDFTAVDPTVLTFGPSVTTQTVTVPTSQNSTDSGTKNLTFSVKLSKQVDATLADASALGTIVDDEGTPVATKNVFLAIDDLRVTEGDSAVVKIRRRGDTAVPASVKVTTADGTALAGSDYTAVPLTTVSFGAGVTTQTITVPTLEGSGAESAETFAVKLSVQSANAVLEDNSATVTINDDDQVLPQVSIDDVQVREGKAAVFTVTRSGDVSQVATVKYATSNASATDGLDYTGQALTPLTFGVGDVTKTITVPTTADSVSELLELFRVTLSTPTNMVLGDNQGTATILDEGVDAPAFRIDDVNVAEGSTAVVTVTRSGDLSEAASVSISTGDATAVAGTDYTALPATVLSFAPGVATRTVSIDTVANATDATPKNLTFSVKLTLAVNAGVADSSAVVTIVDDEGAPIAAKSNFFSVGDLRVTEGGSVVVTVTRRGATGTTASVKLATTPSSAGLGDYSSVSSTLLTFNPGDITKTVTIATVDDAVAENVEGFSASLSAPSSNAQTEDSAGVVTIVDND